MPRFSYKAKTATGETVIGTVDAEGRGAAFSELVGRRLVVLSIEEARDAGGPSRIAQLATLLQSQRVRADSLIFFTYQLSAMLRAGLPIVRSLTVLEEEMTEAYFRQVIQNVRAHLEGGEAFSDSLARYPKVFNRLYVNLVAAGEQSGNLDEVLQRLAQYMDTMLRLMRKIRGALTYPAVLMVVTVAVVTLLMVKVIPVFEDVYGESGVALPGVTQMVIDASRFLRFNLGGIALGIAGIGIAFVWFYRTKRGRRVVHAAMLKIPVVGVLIRKNLLARMGRTLSVLISSGMPMLASLALVRQATAHALFEEALEQASDSIERGESLSASLRESGQFSSMFLQMVSAGEETGKLPEMLSNVADFYENEVNAMADTLSTLLEPIFIVGVGGTIGLIVVAMYLPIFSLGQVMQ